MRVYTLQLIAIAATITLSTQAQPANQSEGSRQNDSQAASVTGVRLSKLMDAQIQSSSGEDLGKLHDIIVNPRSGKVDFAILGRGGILGLGEKLVPVPWEAVTVKSETEFNINVDKEKLQTAPTIDKSFSSIQDPGYTVTIYRFFAVPSDVGGAESPGKLERGKDQRELPSAGTSTNNNSSNSSDQ